MKQVQLSSFYTEIRALQNGDDICNKNNSYNAFAVENFGHQISAQLGVGLSDNWSQVQHYISQTKADNHAVREAACACIAELASKPISLGIHMTS
ncbi:hypothetical protein TNCV_837721 [Trichonephila clavipes]|nr:hypothetical protein TNCV_837721 [Trichonephila clavipes]